MTPAERGYRSDFAVAYQQHPFVEIPAFASCAGERVGQVIHVMSCPHHPQGNVWRVRLQSGAIVDVFRASCRVL